nr:immunoglobulin heavy chain junction region [Macaca mulatta]
CGRGEYSNSIYFW